MASAWSFSDNIELDRTHRPHHTIKHRLVCRSTTLVAREGHRERLTGFACGTCLKRWAIGLASWWRCAQGGGEGAAGRVERKRLYSENFACPVHWRRCGGTLTTAVLVQQPLRRCPDFATASATLRTSPLKRWWPGRACRCYLRRSPPGAGERTTSYYFSLLLRSGGRSLGFRNMPNTALEPGSPLASNTTPQPAGSCGGQPLRAIAVASCPATHRTQCGRATCGTFEGILADPGAPAARRQLVRRSARSSENQYTWDTWWHPAAPLPLACGYCPAGALCRH